MSSTQPTLTAINKLKTNPNNPRAIRKDQLDKLVKSLREFPEMLEARPIVVDPDFVVLGGNMRLKAAQLAGLTEVPVYVASWEEAKHKEFIIKDNLAFGEWDWDMLANEWDAEELDDWGLDVPLEDEPTEGLTDPDDVPEIPEEPTTKPGDLWILGDHRLFCGDSTKAEDVGKLMNGEKADIGFTSPPYNVGKTIRGNLYDNDNDNKSEYLDFLVDFTNEMIENCKYSFINIQALYANWNDVFEWQYKNIKHIKDILIWNKSQCPPNIQPGSFNTKFEFVFALTKEKSNGRNFPCKWQGKYPNVIETESNAKNEFADVHKAGFPVSFPMWIIEKMDFSETVLDPFMGTGTTLIASERLNRKCYGMELDPKYCDVIVKRWEDFTGKKAELCSNTQT